MARNRILLLLIMVSILTQPVGRVQRAALHGGHADIVVSILTQPVGRVQLLWIACVALVASFQSSPSP